jgi:hypothetical protein
MNEVAENVFLFLLLIAALYFPFRYGEYEAFIDAQKILIDADKDSLKQKFHRYNFMKRFFVAVLVVFLITLAVRALSGFTWWFTLPYLLYFGAMFNYTFTVYLNKKRGLNNWYVSRSPDAANYDKTIIKLADKIKQNPYKVNEILNEFILTVSIFCLIVYMLIEYFK